MVLVIKRTFGYLDWDRGYGSNYTRDNKGANGVGDHDVRNVDGRERD